MTKLKISDRVALPADAITLAPGVVVSRARAQARFDERVTKGPVCWLWRASRRHTYGQINLHPFGPVYAHRLSYVLYHGEIPDGMFVCHRCDTPLCVKPEHLFLGTPRDNSRDMLAKGRGSEPPRRYGPEHHMAKQTTDEVQEIRRLWATGAYTQRQLARQFGVTQSTIWRLVNRVTRNEDVERRSGR